MVYVPLPGVGADDHGGNPKAVPFAVDLWRCDVVVEPAPVVPCQEYGGAAPVGTFHDRVDQSGHVGLTRLLDWLRWMLTHREGGDDPRYLGEGAVAGGRVEGCRRLHVRELPVLLHIVERGKRVPDVQDIRRPVCRSGN